MEKTEKQMTLFDLDSSFGKMSPELSLHKNSTIELMGITKITDWSLVTPYGELVYFIIHPTNISVLSESSIGSRIYA